MPAGYNPAAWRVQSGLMLNGSHVVADVFAAYDNGTKENDGTVNNIKGHDRYLYGFVAARAGHNYFGAGARWSELSTTNYVKGETPLDAVKNGDFRLQAVYGHDWIGNTGSARGQINYAFPAFHESINYGPGQNCSGCGNGVQGPEMSLQLPARPKHLFLREVMGLYEYHTTVTEPGNIPLTRQQDSSRHVMCTVDFMLGWRF